LNALHGSKSSPKRTSWQRIRQLRLLDVDERFNANAWSSNHIILGKGVYSNKYHVKIELFSFLF
jgi:hypothetical protein